MRFCAVLAVTTMVTAIPATARAQDANSEVGGAGIGEIVVTARKRTETLKDVPVAATAVTGDIIEKRGLSSVRDIASLTPGLNINSDGGGRAFIAIRGVGVTLVDTVQPGVGLFIDGVYQQNTSYLNNPLVDVERVEVLRGPQGTLYGKNTLGGAINIITKQPGNTFEGTAIASYAGSDDSWFTSGSISGPIVKDRLQVRVAYGHRQQDGFIKNTLLNRYANTLNTDTINATIRATPVADVVLTVNGSYDWVLSGSLPYSFVSGPQDYQRNIAFNATNLQNLHYKRLNGKLEFPVAAINTDVTLVGAFDERVARLPDGDLDFSPVDIARNDGLDILRTRTAELRFDTKLSSTLSSIVGLFYSRETRDGDTITTLFPGVLDIRNQQISHTGNNTWAIYGNIFWRPTDAIELSAGLRYDDQKRHATGAVFINGDGGPIPNARLSENHLSPRVAITYHWTGEVMTYASISRGFRGGGFNSPVAPFRTYKGDNVWTYEVGAKYASADRRLALSLAAFYNDYKDYIGLNSIAPAVTGGFTTVDLNTGNVESYGVELEAQVRPLERWSISGGVSLQHARLTDTSIYTEVTGRQLASNRLTFQPDWNFNLNTDYTVPVGDKDEVTFSAGVIGKGSRIAASLSETDAPVLNSYALVNGSITWGHGPVELSAFVNNLFDKKYFESYIEKTTLILAGLTPSDIGIVGDARRYGVRARVKF
ncbi:TonB-dependent receptor [Novosphingobium sp. PP1Y]|uniref:TonB-dependent receptor n=1 Tax=Novosphingobium sp. PP1Y TaxID=702113 RepID=UPI00030A7B92|nr:TonB-dependent receptor [Novosphingobium sp. PP1Y]